MLVAARAGDEQRDQAEAVGDDVAGALAQPVPDEHADGGAQQDRGHVHDGADAREHHVSSRSARGRRSRLPNGVVLGVISHLGQGREVSGHRRAGRPLHPCHSSSPVAGWERCPHVPLRDRNQRCRPGRRRRPRRGLGSARRASPPGPGGHARHPGGGRRDRPDRRRPGPAAGRRPHRRRRRRRRAPDARPAVPGAQRHRGLRHAPPGHRVLPPARRGPRAPGGHGQLGRGEGHRARHRGGVGGVPRRQPLHGPARPRPDRGGPRRDRPGAAREAAGGAAGGRAGRRPAATATSARCWPSDARCAAPRPGPPSPSGRESAAGGAAD